MSSSQEVLFTERKGVAGDIGIITLNRPAVLNALNHRMIVAMATQLQTWATAKHIKAVVICATPGRAFCAGGDLRLAYAGMVAKDPAAYDFFRDEYALNRLIYHYPKPYIALLDGITMGGGAGISVHGSHRVATTNLLFAMPETGIGFYPDVGGTYFLPRLPAKTGFYLGLTGARLAVDDCVALGIVQYKVANNALADIMTALITTPFAGSAYDTVTTLLQTFQQPIEQSPLLAHQASIKTCFAAETIEVLLDNLKGHPGTFCQTTYETLLTKSPTSLKVTLLAFQRALLSDFDACMQQEERLTHAFVKAPDFKEGIRAMIIEKHQQPKWHPACLSDIDAKMVAAFF